MSPLRFLDDVDLDPFWDEGDFADDEQDDQQIDEDDDYDHDVAGAQ